MNAVAYFKIKKRMTLNCQTDCKICKLYFKNNGTGKRCAVFEMHFPEKAVAIVEKWAEEHPCETRMSSLLKKIPKATVLKYADGEYIEICPVSINNTRTCPNGECKKCKFEYWNEEVEE